MGRRLTTLRKNVELQRHDIDINSLPGGMRGLATPSYSAVIVTPVYRHTIRPKARAGVADGGPDRRGQKSQLMIGNLFWWLNIGKCISGIFK